MIIKANIIKTADGYYFRNAESDKLIGTIHEGRTTTQYRWETFGDAGWGDLKQALYTLKEVLAQRAANLGCDIEFINI